MNNDIMENVKIVRREIYGPVSKQTRYYAEVKGQLNQIAIRSYLQGKKRRWYISFIWNFKKIVYSFCRKQWTTHPLEEMVLCSNKQMAKEILELIYQEGNK